MCALCALLASPTAPAFLTFGPLISSLSLRPLRAACSCGPRWTSRPCERVQPCYSSLEVGELLCEGLLLCGVFVRPHEEGAQNELCSRALDPDGGGSQLRLLYQ